MTRTTTTTIIGALALCAGLVGCSSSADDTATAQGGEDLPTIAVTTNILGDVVENLVGDAAEVLVVMPAGSDPHDFEASAQVVDRMQTADALVTNGADFEAGLAGAITTAEEAGVPTIHAIDEVATLDFGASDHAHSDEAEAHSEEEAHSHDEDEAHSEEEAHSHDEDEAHSEEEQTAAGAEEPAPGGAASTTEATGAGTEEEAHSEEEGEHDHDHEGVDPHFFTDPARMAEAAAGIAAFLAAEVPALDTPEVQEQADAYVTELRDLDASVEETLDVIPEAGRVLITNHEVFGYFADRYGFEVVGVVVPGGTTGGEPSAGELVELVEVVEAEGVPAVFADTSSPTDLAETLAAEAGGEVEVVELFSESLGEEGSGGETYVAMVTTNADRIAGALG